MSKIDDQARKDHAQCVADSKKDMFDRAVITITGQNPANTAYGLGREGKDLDSGKKK